MVLPFGGGGICTNRSGLSGLVSAAARSSSSRAGSGLSSAADRLISIIPNMFPLAVTGASMVLMGQTLELVSVCAFTVCLGIAVDDTIHFLTRYEEERLKTKDENEAIRAAFTGVGTALIMTTIVLVVGFSTVLFSDMRDQRIFAAMSGLTIGSALFGDLIFLPALLSRFTKNSPPAVAHSDEAFRSK